MRARMFVIAAAVALLATAGLIVLFSPQRAEAEYCETASITDLNTHGDPPGIKKPGYMILDWSLDITPWPEDSDVHATYSVVRRPADGNEWEPVAIVDDRTQWEGAPKYGAWIYVVALYSLRIDGTEETCDGIEAETVMEMPTEAELAPKLLAELCGRSGVEHLELVRPRDGLLKLEWDDDLDYFYEDVQHDLRRWEWDATTFRADTVVYRVQRSPTAFDNTPLGWTTLAETTKRTWTGPAEPGHWDYRVGTILMTKGSVSVGCKPSYADTHLYLQTAEQAAEQARQSAILQAEATRCAIETLAGNLQGESRQIVAGVIAKRVAETVALRKNENHPDLDFEFLVSLSVLLCTGEGPPTGYGAVTSPVWNALTLLSLTDPYW